MKQRGFTLVELMVVTTISSILVLLAMRAWQPHHFTTLALRHRAHAVSDLRLSADALLQDLGGAETLSIVAGKLLIQREEAVAVLAGGWTGAADAGVLYGLRNGEFTRRDVASGVTVVISNIDGFLVQDVSGDLRVTLSNGTDSSLRTVTLIWPA